MVSSALPWDYDAIVLRHARESLDLLDLGTGGGEWLARLPHRPARTVATEAWEPNVDVAGARLRLLGVTVVRDEGAPDNVEQVRDEGRGRLPFPTGSFGLVVNRHEAFVAREVARILVASGRFITQQAGSASDDFHRLLGLPLPERPAQDWTRSLAVTQVEAAGLKVLESEEAEETLSFTDVGAVAWYLKAVAWTVPGFSTSSHGSQLEKLHARIAHEGPAVVRQPRFWLEAVKPRST